MMEAPLVNCSPQASSPVCFPFAQSLSKGPFVKLRKGFDPFGGAQDRRLNPNGECDA